MNLCNIKRTFELIPVRKWDTIYVLIDVHGTIIPGSWHRKNEFKFISEDCAEVLRWFTKRKDIKLILWTSSREQEIDEIVMWLWAFHDIGIDYVNENPEAKETEYAVFGQKPYFNILIDDKAGFEPEKDWAAIKRELQEIGEWNKM